MYSIVVDWQYSHSTTFFTLLPFLNTFIGYHIPNTNKKEIKPCQKINSAKAAATQ